MSSDNLYARLHAKPALMVCTPHAGPAGVNLCGAAGLTLESDSGCVLVPAAGGCMRKSRFTKAQIAARTWLLGRSPCVAVRHSAVRRIVHSGCLQRRNNYWGHAMLPPPFGRPVAGSGRVCIAAPRPGHVRFAFHSLRLKL